MKWLDSEFKKNIALVGFGVFLWWFLSNIQVVLKVIKVIMGAFSPLLVGFIIAFILNRPVMFFEKKLKKAPWINSNYRRSLSVFLTLLLCVILFVLLILIIVPNLIEVSIELSEKFPEYLESINAYFKQKDGIFLKFNEYVESIDVDALKKSVVSFVKSGFFNWLGSSFSIASIAFGSIVTVFLGFIFSVYFLIQKESIIRSIKRVILRTTNTKTLNKLTYFGNITNQSFSNFILAQLLEAFILGSLFFVVLSIFRFPYASMISIVIAVFSIIPMVGSFVGLFVGAVLIFVESPQLSGMFIIVFIILQQIEGNLIYPKVVGKISGLSPLLTLTAITVGGSLMGVVGMLLFVPLFSVIQKVSTPKPVLHQSNSNS